MVKHTYLDILYLFECQALFLKGSDLYYVAFLFHYIEQIQNAIEIFTQDCVTLIKSKYYAVFKRETLYSSFPLVCIMLIKHISMALYKLPCTC